MTPKQREHKLDASVREIQRHLIPSPPQEWELKADRSRKFREMAQLLRQVVRGNAARDLNKVELGKLLRRILAGGLEDLS